MVLKRILNVLLVTIILVSPNFSLAQLHDDGHMKVAMRMIGHKLLLMTGDSTSRVMPVEKLKEGKYKVAFETSIDIYPQELSDTIAQIVEETGIAESYRVELRSCETQDVHYSYEIGDSTRTDIVPCGTRPLHRNCYYLIFTSLDEMERSKAIIQESETGMKFLKEPNPFNYWTIVLLVVPILLIGGLLYWQRKRTSSKSPAHVTIIGKYQFDKRNMLLLLPEQKIELSSKESDLLSVLHDSANNTVEREEILKLVWGDEGDYIGRTLDVFISKLRKKLQEDTNIKIINIRGVGYKLVINDDDN